MSSKHWPFYLQTKATSKVFLDLRALKLEIFKVRFVFQIHHHQPRAPSKQTEFEQNSNGLFTRLRLSRFLHLFNQSFTHKKFNKLTKNDIKVYHEL